MAKEKKNPVNQASPEARKAAEGAVREKALKIAALALDKKAADLVILEMKNLTSFTDYFVICTGESSTQVSAISDNITDGMKKDGLRPAGIEGLSQARWVLLDYSDVIVHIFDRETRIYYDLEKLWLDAPRIEAPQAGPASGNRGRKGPEN